MTAAVHIKESPPPDLPRPLPTGRNLARVLRALFAIQRQAALAYVRGGHDAYLAWMDNRFGPAWHVRRPTVKMGQQPGEYTGPASPLSLRHLLPDAFVDLSAWDGLMADACRPLVEMYADQAGRGLLSRIGASADVFSVIQPNLAPAIDALTLAFCEETNATTSRALSDALAATKAALKEGMLEGEPVAALTKRVNEVFDQAEGHRANRIAETESSRAVHAAEMVTAKESGVISRVTWLASGDACQACLALANKSVEVGEPFTVVEGARPEYATVYHPPLHPHCNCSTTMQADPAALRPGVDINAVIAAHAAGRYDEAERLLGLAG